MATAEQTRARLSGDDVPPWALVLAGAVSVQFGAAVAVHLFTHVGAVMSCTLRLAFAAVVLVAVWRPRPRDYSRGQLRLAVVFGLVLGGMNLCFYEGLDRLPLGVAVTIEFLGPLGVAVAGSRRASDLALTALAAAGVVLLARPGGGLDALGVAFVLGAAACWAAYIVVTQRVGAQFTGGRGLALASAVAVLVPLGPAVAHGTAGLGPGALALGLAVGLMSSVIPYSLETAALRRMRASAFGVLMSLDPAVAAVAGLAVLGQGLAALDALAIGCVVVASVGVMRAAP